jgi:hypothetical protein
MGWSLDIRVHVANGEFHGWVEGHNSLEWMRLTGTNSFLSQDNGCSKCNIRAGTEAPNQKFSGIVEIGMCLDVGD